MEPITTSIRVVVDRTSAGYRTKFGTAYAALAILMGGDAIRYAIGWLGWALALAVLLISTLIQFFRSDWRTAIGRVPWPLSALLGLMLVGSLWSNYQLVSLGAALVQLATTSFALFLASSFTWREILRVVSGTLRGILFSSVIFELYAALIVRGPIEPFFPNYSGDHPPAVAFYWTQGNLFSNDRIQGIVGNSNMLAYMAMIAVVVFAIEVAANTTSRLVSVLSFLAAIPMLVLSRSASIGFALAAIVAAAIVSIAAEGKDRDTRHRYYRVAWGVIGTAALLVLTYRAEIFSLIGKSPDMTGRTKIWKIVLHLIDQRPLQGWGWSSYWVPWVEPYKGLVVINHVPYYQAHNAFLDVWMQLGIFGLGLFLLLIGLTFVRLWRLAVRHTSPLYLWPILVFVGIVTQNLTESRILVEIGWVLLVLFSVKVLDPVDTLEPLGKSPKRARLKRLAKR
ncbi:MAG: O-antigen ligase family protein [Micrococcales bacterium]